MVEVLGTWCNGLVPATRRRRGTYFEYITGNVRVVFENKDGVNDCRYQIDTESQSQRYPLTRTLPTFVEMM